jgi:hypothetical protein
MTVETTTSDENASDKFSRVTNSLSRLARTILTYSQHRDVVAKEKADEPQQVGPSRKLDYHDHLAIAYHVNRLFGVRQYPKPLEPELKAPIPSRIPAPPFKSSNPKPQIQPTDNAIPNKERNENL